MKLNNTGWTVVVALAAFPWLIGCPSGEGLPPGVVPPDDTFYVGAQACSSCHASVASLHFRTGHSQALKPVLSAAPAYPAPAAGVPAPPPGLAWTDIAYTVGGYQYAARFVDTRGFVVTGAAAQYNIPIPAIDLPGGFVPYLADAATPTPFDYPDFYRLTTGSMSLESSGGRRQDNRPGINGVWAEPGVQCEACHGPGSKHVPNPSAGNIILDAGPAACATCHTNDTDPQRILAADGLIGGFQQWTELQASPHASFSCTVCHNPHADPAYDPANAIRNNCRACHPSIDMGLHENLVFTRGDYTEPVTCESCHMPFAVKTRSQNTINLTNGRTATFGDTRSHIFRLDPSAGGVAGMFAEGGAIVARDASGQASVSTCYVCQRCHDGQGNAFAFPAGEGCAFGTDIHSRSD